MYSLAFSDFVCKDTANARPFVQGDSHAISLGTKKELQNRRSELVRNGVLRFRLRLNIYKDLRQESKNNENVHNPPPSKRRRMESSVSSGLTDLLSSLESLWSNRAQTGDITILCDGQEIKAHRFILSGLYIHLIFFDKKATQCKE